MSSECCWDPLITFCRCHKLLISVFQSHLSSLLGWWNIWFSSIINIPLRNYLSFSGPEVAGVASKWCRRLRVQKDTTENFKYHHFCMVRAPRTPVIHCKFSHMNILCFIVFKFLWEPSVFLIWQNYSYNSTFEPVSSDLPEQWHRIILSMLQQTARNVWEMCLMSENLVLNLSTPVQ